MAGIFHSAHVKCAGGLLALMLWASSTAMAQVELLWNPPDGGPGNWDTTSMLWSSTFADPPDTIWNNATDNYAYIFGIGGTITVQSGGVNVHNLLIYSDGYTFSGGTLRLDHSLPEIVVMNSSDTATINSAITATDLYIASTNGTSGSGAYTDRLRHTRTRCKQPHNRYPVRGRLRIGAGTLQIKKFRRPGTGAVDIGGNTSPIRLMLDGASGL